MTPFLSKLLCDPLTKSDLQLVDPEHDTAGNILSGLLKNSAGNTYPIVRGIPRFCSDSDLRAGVQSFGDQWNYFNFIELKQNWKGHTVKNTLGSTEVFKGKVVVDGGSGSGAQALWMLEQVPDT